MVSEQVGTVEASGLGTGAPGLAPGNGLLRGAADGARAFLRRAGPLAPSSSLLAAASRRTGLDTALIEPVMDALDMLLASLRDEARLSAFGLIGTRHDIVAKLANLLILQDRERADPTIVSRPVTAPIFITGLPRSGTSFLHALLAEHPSLTAPRAWQACFPVPDHPSAGRGAGREKFARQLAIFHRLAPELASLHPISTDTPQECTEIMATIFRSLRFDSTHDVPSYRVWLDRAGFDQAYRFHKRFLQHLSGGRSARWVLKSPDHVFSLEALRRVYPDARLVVVHRDPLHVVASVARLTELLRRPFSRSVDRLAIGRQVIRDWLEGMRRILDLDDADALHVRHLELVADPLGTARRLCAGLDVAFGASAAARIARHAEQRPRGGYGQNRYCLSDYAIAADELEDLRSRYLARFGLKADISGSVRR